MKVITDPRCAEYFARGHPERPERVTRSVELLKAQSHVPISWVEPAAVDDAQLALAHVPWHLEAMRHPVNFDADTPAHPGIEEHARRSVGGALAAMRSALTGEPAFSLMRPPGHHATRSQAMGFCYYNSIAVAALAAQSQGANRVAVYDFDVHHGNGTEDILLDEKGFAFFSIHQNPAYPGTGLADRGANCRNYPVAPATPRQQYRATLSSAWEAMLAGKPDLLAISAGFDAYHKDPLAKGTLEAEDFHWLGETVRRAAIPAFAILEGGYSSDLPELVLAFLAGWNG